MCIMCGKTFKNKRLQIRKTCSAECLSKHISHRGTIWHNVICMICGKKFKAKGSDYHRYRKTCSKICMHKLCSRIQKGKNHSLRIVWHTMTCVICGAKFMVTGTQYHNDRKTCSPKCLHKIRVRSGLRTPWHSIDTRRKIGKKAKTHFKTGHFPTNINGKDYSIKSPHGEVFQFHNLSYFADKRRDVFAEVFGGIDKVKYSTIRGGVTRLAPWRRDKTKSWHGWTWHDDCSNN